MSTTPLSHATRSLAALALGAAAVAGSAAPAHAADAPLLSIPVTCDGASAPEVVLSYDDVSYDVRGVCGTVRITGDRIHVTMGTATRLIVEGSGNVVRSKSLERLDVRGTDQQVSPVSVKDAVLIASHSTLTVDGLLEDITVTGAGNTVTSDRMVGARLRGNGNRLSARRLYRLAVPGDRNRAQVAEGATAVRVSGVDNRISVHRRA